MGSHDKSRRDALFTRESLPSIPASIETPTPIVENHADGKNDKPPECVQEEMTHEAQNDMDVPITDTTTEALVDASEAEQEMADETEGPGEEATEEVVAPPQFEKSTVRFVVREESDEDERSMGPDEEDMEERKLVEEESRNMNPERSETFQRLTRGIHWPKGASFMIRAGNSSRELAISKTFKDSSRQAIHQAVAGQTGVVLEAEKVVLKRLLYVSQGRLDHYTADALQKRYGLRDDSLLKEAVKRWWSWLPKEEANNKVPFLHITRPVYFAWVVMIQMVLLPRFGMQADIDYDPTDDWEDDNETELSVLGYDTFFKALFKVPDLWCDGVDARDYTDLLNSLLDEAKKRRNLWNRLLKRFGFCDPKDRQWKISGAVGFGTGVPKLNGGVIEANAFPVPGALSAVGGKAGSSFSMALPQSPKARTSSPGLSPQARSGPLASPWGSNPSKTTLEASTPQSPKPSMTTQGASGASSQSPKPSTWGSNPSGSSQLGPAHGQLMAQPPSRDGRGFSFGLPLTVTPSSHTLEPWAYSHSPTSEAVPTLKTPPLLALQAEPVSLRPASSLPLPKSRASYRQSPSFRSGLPSSLAIGTITTRAPESINHPVTPVPAVVPTPASTSPSDFPSAHSLDQAPLVDDPRPLRPEADQGAGPRPRLSAAGSGGYDPQTTRATTAAGGARVSNSGNLVDGRWSHGWTPPSPKGSFAASPGGGSRGGSRGKRISAESGADSVGLPQGRDSVGLPHGSSRVSIPSGGVREGGKAATTPLSIVTDQMGEGDVDERTLLLIPKWAAKATGQSLRGEAPNPSSPKDPASSPLRSSGALPLIPHPMGEDATSPTNSFTTRLVWEKALMPEEVEWGGRGGMRSSWAGHGRGSNVSTLTYIWAPPRKVGGIQGAPKPWLHVSPSNGPQPRSPHGQHPPPGVSSQSPSGRDKLGGHDAGGTDASDAGGSERRSKGRGRWASSSGAFDQARSRVSMSGGGGGGVPLRPSINGGATESPRHPSWVLGGGSSQPQGPHVELNGLDLFWQAFPRPLADNVRLSSSGMTDFQQRFSTDGQGKTAA